MLQAPDKTTTEILELAKFIEELSPGRYRQSSYRDSTGARCICGWFNYRNCHFNSDDWRYAQEKMGLTKKQAQALFEGHPFNYYRNEPPTAKEAARVLRHLAVTGEVDWSFA